jgi:RND family efflux transporter MFP subunit
VIVKLFKKKKFLPALIALAGCAVTLLLVALGKEAEFQVITSMPLSVETLFVKKTDYQIQVPAWGFVAPRETLDICAEVRGKVVQVPDSVFAGAGVKENELLFKIDDRTYQNTLAEAIAEKSQAQQALEIEKGRQIIAEKEWEFLENSKWQGSKNKSLALRIPQLREREAALQIAAAKQVRAELDVERTQITAPCDGVILNENLALGRFLEIGDAGLQIACTDCYHVTAFFSPQYAIDPGASTVSVNIGANRHEGVIRSVLPEIDQKTRHKQVLIEFSGSQVVLGDYVELMLPGPFFGDVIVIPKKALRSGNTVWVLSENRTLEIRTVRVLGQDMENVVVGEGLFKDDQVVLSHIASPLAGMKLTALQQKPENNSDMQKNGEPAR